MAKYKIDNSSSCDKCGKKGVMKSEGRHYIMKLDCKCGGMFKTDYNLMKEGDKNGSI